MTERKIIVNAQVVLPDEVIEGYVLIEGDKIAAVGEGAYPEIGGSGPDEVIDAAGCYVMPGMIDLHSDAIEREMQPRPNALFPIEPAFYELEKKLAASGITTMYHSLSLSDEWGVRDKAMVLKVIDVINRFQGSRLMIRHKIHLRYELTYLAGIKILEELIRSGSIDFMSYMDHTPGQGQYRNVEELKKYNIESYGKNAYEMEEMLDRTVEAQKMIDWDALSDLAKLARDKGIRLASHDDDSREEIEALLQNKGVLSEFPVNLDTAVYAKERGVHVCVGAPNLVRGGSHNSNMKAIDAVACKAADIICSDYMPGALLPAVFKLVDSLGMELSAAVRMTTLNPASAVGIDQEFGTVEAGKSADLLIVEMYRNYPMIRRTLVGGKCVLQSDFFQEAERKRVDDVC